jgi:tRNA A37 methylthiotransferase MiaB
MNYADTARIKSVLTHCGRTYTDQLADADVVIFDTCSVRQKSEDKITGKLKSIGKYQKVRITGCMIQHNLRNTKINLDPLKRIPDTLKIGNFLGSIEAKDPEVVGVTADEINEHKYNPNTKQIGINHAFNPLFHNLKQKRSNIELFFRIDDTGFLPLMLNKIGYTVNYDQELINEYINIVPEDMNTSMNNHSKTAYVPISTGCNQFCSYCIVPYAR